MGAIAPTGKKLWGRRCPQIALAEILLYHFFKQVSQSIFACICIWLNPCNQA